MVFEDKDNNNEYEFNVLGSSKYKAKTQWSYVLELLSEGFTTERIFREFDCLKACSAMAGQLGAISLNLI